MRNNKKKPSVFKNILIIAGCTMFAALYAMTALYIYAGMSDNAFYGRTASVFAQRDTAEIETQEQESLPAWTDRVEIEIESETVEQATEYSDIIEQEPRFNKDAEKEAERDTVFETKRKKHKRRV